MGAPKTRREADIEEAREMGREELKDDIIEKIDGLIWRRKLLGKPVDLLEEIQTMVVSL